MPPTKKSDVFAADITAALLSLESSAFPIAIRLGVPPMYKPQLIPASWFAFSSPAAFAAKKPQHEITTVDTITNTKEITVFLARLLRLVISKENSTSGMAIATNTEATVCVRFLS